MDTGIGYPSLLLKTLGLSLILAFTQGCAVSVHSTHEPMHPAAGDIVYLGAMANGSVDKIEIWAEVSEVTVCGPEGAEQEVVQDFRRIARCNPFGWRRSLTCWGSMRGNSLPDHSIVRYHAVAASPLGERSVDEYSFAAGDYPCINRPVPIRAVTDDTSAAIDVVVVRDPDIDEDLFDGYLDDLIDFKFFKFDVFRDARHLYNFWYSREPGEFRMEGDDCVFDHPDTADYAWNALSDEANVADAVVFLHATYKDDCALGVSLSSEFWSELTLVHEAGHAIFGLRDEYNRSDSTVYGQQEEGPPNLWEDRDACMHEASELGFDADDCRTRSPAGLQAIIDLQGLSGCIMGQQLRSSYYGPACRLRVKWKHGLCDAGNCRPQPETETN